MSKVNGFTQALYVTILMLLLLTQGIWQCKKLFQSVSDEQYGNTRNRDVSIIEKKKVVWADTIEDVKTIPVPKRESIYMLSSLSSRSMVAFILDFLNFRICINNGSLQKWAQIIALFYKGTFGLS